ncbi:MAG: PIN domain-containing protein [Colwellia sp.]|jgi:hypothetical protein
MKIFLDTNVFYNNWFTDNPNFKLMFRYLNNEQDDLLISDLVVQETENIRNREIGESLSEIKRQIKKIRKLNPESIIYDSSNLNIKNYNLIEQLKNNVECIENISYENISNKDLISRAFSSKKPFSGKEKGYRDALIWLSFVDYLASNNIEERIIFITDNKSDFYTIKNKTISLHPDLQMDLDKRDIKAKITPYLNLFDFINKEVVKDDHLIDKMKWENELDGFLLVQTEAHLVNLNKNSLSELLGTNLFKDRITDILNVTCEIWDGIDDTDILSVSKISETEAYISCHYIVTGVDLKVTVDLIEYNQHQDEIDSLNGCNEVFIDNESATVDLSFGYKAYVSGSLVFSTLDEEPKILNIETIEF